MQRRRIAVAAAVVAAAGTAVAFTLPSMAGTTSQRDRTAAPTTGRVASSLLAAMKRDLGLTADQANAQVKRAMWASGVATRLRTEAGSAYAGSWLTDGGMTLNIGVTDAAMAAEVRAAGAVPRLVQNSVAELDGAKQALDKASTKTARSGLPGWYVDVAANKVAVQALPGQAAKAQQLAEAAGIPADQLKVVTVRSAPRPLADVIGAQPYFITLGKQTARCSIGFSVTIKGQDGGADSPGFITAGHCGQTGDQTADLNQQASGQVKASTFPGDADMGLVEVNANETPQPFVDDFNGNALPVAGSTEAPVGATVCRSGSTSGTHCGTILAKNESVNYPEGTVTGLTRTDACAEGGDSGGPWLVGDQAQGVTSGGSGDCTTGGETFFQPVSEILGILGADDVTLVTTDAQGGAGNGDDGGQGAGNGDNGGQGAGNGDNGGQGAGNDDNGGQGAGNGDNGGQGAGNGDQQAGGDDGGAQDNRGQQAGDGQQQDLRNGGKKQHRHRL